MKFLAIESDRSTEFHVFCSSEKLNQMKMKKKEESERQREKRKKEKQLEETQDRSRIKSKEKVKKKKKNEIYFYLKRKFQQNQKKFRPNMEHGLVRSFRHHYFRIFYIN